MDTFSYANMLPGFSEMDAWEALAPKSWIVVKKNNIKVVLAVAEVAYVYELFYENILTGPLLEIYFTFYM